MEVASLPQPPTLKGQEEAIAAVIREKKMPNILSVRFREDRLGHTAIPAMIRPWCYLCVMTRTMRKKGLVVAVYEKSTKEKADSKGDLPAFRILHTRDRLLFEPVVSQSIIMGGGGCISQLHALLPRCCHR